MTMPRKGSRSIRIYTDSDTFNATVHRRTFEEYRYMVSGVRMGFFFVTIQEDKENPGRPLRVRMPSKKSRNDRDDLVEETYPVGYDEVAYMIRHGKRNGWDPSGKKQVQVDMRFNYHGQLTVPVRSLLAVRA